MKRDTASTIFRTVVFAGAMLGTTACASKKPAPQPPTNTATDPKAGEAQLQADPNAKPGDSADPCAGYDPCAGGERPRGTDVDGGGGTGRGFILS